jgi:hypothetical protein
MANFIGSLRRATRMLLKQRRITLFAVIGLSMAPSSAVCPFPAGIASCTWAGTISAAVSLSSM